MEDCSVAMDSLHIIMAACVVCGLALGGILGAWIASRSLEKNMKEYLRNHDQE
tara:strand:- start:257 stop:415 length:159 start_codon:yes stop_codon:yes gene_type:complete